MTINFGFLFLVCFLHSGLAQVNNHICTDKGKGASALEGLPRVNRRLEAVSTNWGDYPIYTCEPDPQDSTKQVCVFIDVGSIDFKGGNDAMSGYLDSIITYFGFAIALGILTFLTGICIGFWRYCCFCIPGGCCGKRWPTKKSTFFCFPGFLGYVELKKADSNKTYAYPMKYRMANRIYMWIFFFFILLWIGMGHFQGNEGLTNSMVSVALAPSTLVNTALKSTDLVAEFAETVIGEHFINLLKDLNTTINEVMNISQVLDDLNCTIDFIVNFPDIPAIRAFIDDEIQSIIDVDDVLADVNASFADLERQQNATLDLVNDLDAYIARTEAEFNATKDSINNTFSNLQEVQFIEDTLLSPTAGIDPTVRDLQTVEARPSTDYVNVTSDLLWRLAFLALTAVETDDLLLHLKTIEASYAAFPDMNATATRLENLNANFTYAKQTNMFGNLSKKINDTQDQMTAIANEELVNNISMAIDNIVASVNAINFSSLNDTITRVEQRIHNATNGDEFANKLEAFLDLNTVISCVNSMFNQVKNINNTLVTFPSSVNDGLNTLNDINATLNNATSMIYDYIANLTEFLNSSDAIDFSSIRAQISQLQDQLRNTTAFNKSAVLDPLQDAVDSANITTDINQLQSDLARFSNSLNETDNSTIADLRNASITLPVLLQHIRRQIADVGQYHEQGYCSNNGAINCNTTSASCGVNPCVGQDTYRCKLDGMTSCLGRVDGPCGNDTCLVEQNRLSSLSIEILVFELVLRQANVSNTINTLVGLNDTARTNLNQYQTELDTVNAKMNNVSFDEFKTQLANTTQAFRDFDLAGYQQNMTDLITKSSRLNLTDLDAQLDALNDTMSQINDTKKEVDRVSNLVTAFHTILYVKLPEYFEEINKTALEELRAETGGLEATVDRFANISNDLVQYLNTSQDFYTFTCCNFTDKLEGTRRIVEVVFDHKYRNYGPWHWFMSLKDAIAKDDTIMQPGNGDDLWRLKRNHSNVHYPDDKLCVTKDCIKNEIVYYNTKDISDLADEANINLPIAVKASRTDIVSAPYLVPFFIALFGLIASVLFFEGSMPDFFASLCASISACMMFICMPIIFIFAGSFFVFVLVAGDGCKSAENLGYQILKAEGSTLCPDRFKGIGNSSHCLITALNGSENQPNLEFTVNVYGTYVAVLGGECSNDPLQPIYDSLANSIRNYIPGEADSQIDSQNNKSEVKILPRLRQPLTKFFNATANTTGNLISDVGNQVFGCDALHAVYSDTKDAFCCDVLSAIYWMIASWYLIGWSMLCCGCGAALLGRKRFPSKLWGSAYNADLRALNAKQAEGEEGGWDEEPRSAPLELDNISGGASAGFVASDPQFDPHSGGFDEGAGPMALAHEGGGGEQFTHLSNVNKTPEIVDKGGAHDFDPHGQHHDQEPEFIIEQVDQPPFDLGGDQLGQHDIPFNGPAPVPLETNEGEIEI